MADWQVGDLALCVKYGAEAGSSPWDHGPRIGSVNEVIEVSCDPPLGIHPGGVWLRFALFPDDGYFHEGFVKVTPDTEIQGIEVERKIPAPVQEPVGVQAPGGRHGARSANISTAGGDSAEGRTP